MVGLIVALAVMLAIGHMAFEPAGASTGNLLIIPVIAALIVWKVLTLEANSDTVDEAYKRSTASGLTDAEKKSAAADLDSMYRTRWWSGCIAALIGLLALLGIGYAQYESEKSRPIQYSRSR